MCWPRRDGSAAAAQLLLEDALDGGTHQHRQVIFEPELVVRQFSRARQEHAAQAAPAVVARGRGGDLACGSRCS
jgi:hypothetical protein